MSKEIKLYARILIALIIIVLVYGFGDAHGYRAGVADTKIKNTKVYGRK